MGRLKEARREARELVSGEKIALARKLRRTVKRLPGNTRVEELSFWITHPKADKVPKRVRRLTREIDSEERDFLGRNLKRITRPGRNPHLYTLEKARGFISERAEPVSRIKKEYGVSDKTAAFIVLGLAVKNR